MRSSWMPATVGHGERLVRGIEDDLTLTSEASVMMSGHDSR
jgi:hypothetical protein